MSSERTFLDPLREATEFIHFCREDLTMFARALRLVGNDHLAGRLAALVKELGMAKERIEEGRDMALRQHVSGAEQASNNMVRAALAAADPQAH